MKTSEFETLSSALADSSLVFGGTVGILIAILGAGLAVAWLMLPFLALASLGRIRETLDRTNDLLKKIASQSEALRGLTESLNTSVRTQELANVSLINIDNELQHTNELLRWIGESRLLTTVTTETPAPTNPQPAVETLSPALKTPRQPR